MASKARVRYIYVFIENAASDTVLKDALRALQKKCRKGQTVTDIEDPLHAHRHFYIAEVGGKRVLRKAANIWKLQKEEAV